MGFLQSPNNQCDVSKIINGKQCTIIWHVYNLKISHVKKGVIEDIIRYLENERNARSCLHRASPKIFGMTID